MKEAKDFRTISEFPKYEINQEGILRRKEDGFMPKKRWRENKPQCGEYYVFNRCGEKFERTIKRLIRDAFTEEPDGVDLGFLGYSNYKALSDGDIWSYKTKRILSYNTQITGYHQMTLCSDTGERENKSVHRLIASAFHSNPENLPYVNHINGKKYDNRAENLEWVSAAENAQHAIRTGLRKNYYSKDRKYSNEKIHEVCKLIPQSYRTRDIEAKTGVDKLTIASVRYGSIYVDISSQYDLRAEYPSNRRTDDNKLRCICKRLEEGAKYQDIVDELGVSLSFISTIKNRKAGLYISKEYVW